MEQLLRYDVFISYSSKDQKVAEGVCGYLETKGYRCFVAYRDIPKGEVWASAIADAIDFSKMMVVVFSENFNASKQTDREIELAAENKIPILTFRITNSDFTGAKKYYLKNLNWIDAFPNPDSFFRELCENVSKLLNQRNQEELVEERIKPYIDKKKDTSGVAIHIETDVDCKLFVYEEFKMNLQAGKDNIVYLPPGNYKLTYESSFYSDIKKQEPFTVKREIVHDFIVVKLKEEIENRIRLEEEKRKKKEEEARVKAKEARRKAEEKAFRKKERQESIRNFYLRLNSWLRGHYKIFLLSALIIILLGIGLVVFSPSETIQLPTNSKQKMDSGAVEETDSKHSIQYVKTVKDSMVSFNSGPAKYTGEVDESHNPNGKGKAVFFEKGDVFEGVFSHGKLKNGIYRRKEDGKCWKGDFKDDYPVDLTLYDE